MSVHEKMRKRKERIHKHTYKIDAKNQETAIWHWTMINDDMGDQLSMCACFAKKTAQKLFVDRSATSLTCENASDLYTLCGSGESELNKRKTSWHEGGMCAASACFFLVAQY